MPARQLRRRRLAGVGDRRADQEPAHGHQHDPVDDRQCEPGLRHRVERVVGAVGCRESGEAHAEHPEHARAPGNVMPHVHRCDGLRLARLAQPGVEEQGPERDDGGQDVHAARGSCSRNRDRGWRACRRNASGRPVRRCSVRAVRRPRGGRSRPPR